jgi:hypothetical protein
MLSLWPLPLHSRVEFFRYRSQMYYLYPPKYPLLMHCLRAILRVASSSDSRSTVVTATVTVQQSETKRELQIKS